MKAHLCGGLALFALGCGSEDPPHDLAGVHDVSLSVSANYHVKQPDTVQVFAALSYTREYTECLSLPIEAELDGVTLLRSPNGSGKVGDRCQLGFYVDAAASDSAPDSIVVFKDGKDEVSLGAGPMLAPHALVFKGDAEPARSAGDELSFEWSSAAETLTAVDAYFLSGESSVKGDAERNGNSVTVRVPELDPGTWSIELGAIASGAAPSCQGANECTLTTAGDGALTITIE